MPPEPQTGYVCFVRFVGERSDKLFSMIRFTFARLGFVFIAIGRLPSGASLSFRHGFAYAPA